MASGDSARGRHRRYSVAVLGATGHTGTLVARALAARKNLPFVLAGRSLSRTQELARSVKGGARAVHADACLPPTIQDLCEQSSVLINCAGPFEDLGEPVIRDAIAAGTHYLDTSGEQAYILRAIERLGEDAENAGVVAVPGMAFMPGVADLMASLGSRIFDRVDRIEIAYALDGWRPSPGTVRSALVSAKIAGKRYQGGKWIDERLGIGAKHINFPKPIGRRLALPLPLAEIATIPNQVPVRQVTCYIALPASADRLMGLIPPAGRVLEALLWTPLPRAAASLIDLFPRWQLGEEKARDRFLVRMEMKGKIGIQTLKRAWFARGEGIYPITAEIITEAAETIVKGHHTRPGVLPPGAAFEPEPIFKRLSRLGFETRAVRQEAGRGGAASASA